MPIDAPSSRPSYLPDFPRHFPALLTIMLLLLIASTTPTERFLFRRVLNDPTRLVLPARHQQKLVKHFLSPNKDFSLSAIIRHDQKYFLFVISKNISVVQINLDTFQIVNNYTVKQCDLPESCDQKTTINFLSSLRLHGEHMMYFCYVIAHRSFPSLSTVCVIPKNSKLDKDVHWTKNGFSSTDPTQASIVVASHDDVVFSGSRSLQGRISIMRSRLPDLFGQVDSRSDLVTPMANFYFEDESSLLTGFSTEDSVFFVVQESLSNDGSSSGGGNTDTSLADCVSSRHKLGAGAAVAVTRLIRLCKRDPGDITDFATRQFGTVAKAELSCVAGPNGEGFEYTRAISAEWSDHRLFVLFETQKFSPRGSVLCVFEEAQFGPVFDGPTRSLWPRPRPCSEDNDQAQINRLPHVCKKLWHGDLSPKELFEAKSLASNGLYRWRSLDSKPLLQLSAGVPYRSVQVIRISNDTDIVLLQSQGQIQVNTIMRIPTQQDHHKISICHIFTYEAQSDIRAMEKLPRDDGDSSLSVVVSETKLIAHLDLDVCPHFSSELSCREYAPPICRWLGHSCRITIDTSDTSDTTEHKKQQKGPRGKCSSNQGQQADPVDCVLQQGFLSLQCLCHIDMSTGKRISIHGCKGTLELSQWTAWGDWGPCGVAGFHRRSRGCRVGGDPGSCPGGPDQYRPCTVTSVHHQLASSWSGWVWDRLGTERRLRATCEWRRSGQLKAHLQSESRSYPSSFRDTWTKWSPCQTVLARHRLLSCSSMAQCPVSRVQLHLCEAVESSVRRLQSHQEGAHDAEPSVSDNINQDGRHFTMVHLVLAVLVASVAWLLLISLVLCLRRPHHCRHRSKHDHTTNIASTSISYSNSTSPSQPRLLLSRLPPTPDNDYI